MLLSVVLEASPPNVLSVTSSTAMGLTTLVMLLR